MVSAVRQAVRHMRKRRRAVKLLKLTFTAAIYLCVVFGGRLYDSETEVNIWDDAGTGNNGGRHLLQFMSVLESNNSQNKCTPRAVDEFPEDFFTREQKLQGAVVVHVFIALYMFASLAIVCDDYFVPALEHICNALNLQHDVAGATFMAAGSSAPELATSVIGVFIAQSQIGTGTIVGSAVFNILFIIALCGLFGGAVIKLTWYPLVRDSIVYAISVGVLIVVLHDARVYWYEGLIMVVMYVLYIVLMYFNPQLSAFMTQKVNAVKNGAAITFHNNAADESTSLISGSGESKLRVESSEWQGKSQSEDDEYESPWEFPDGIFSRIFWIIMLPMKAIIFVLVPDCRKPGIWRKLFMLSFLMSVVVISGLSYVMVWMVAIIGDTCGIPDTVMGLTLLAAGTSVPDALASVLVCRDGFGDMAVSNSIGSNIFDILLCLGLPWLLNNTIPGLSTNGFQESESNSLTFTAIALLSTVVFLLVGIWINGWKLDKKFGFICIFVYVIFMTFSCMFELNVFIYVNPEPCPRKHF